MGQHDGRASYSGRSDDDQFLEDTMSEEADYYPDVKEHALGSVDYNPVRPPSSAPFLVHAQTGT